MNGNLCKDLIYWMKLWTKSLVCKRTWESIIDTVNLQVSHEVYQMIEFAPNNQFIFTTQQIILAALRTTCKRWFITCRLFFIVSARDRWPMWEILYVNIPNLEHKVYPSCRLHFFMILFIFVWTTKCHSKVLTRQWVYKHVYTIDIRDTPLFCWS